MRYCKSPGTLPSIPYTCTPVYIPGIYIYIYRFNGFTVKVQTACYYALSTPAMSCAYISLVPYMF